MASIYDLKPAFQRLLLPVLKGLHQAGVSPNQITLAALLLSATGGAMLWMAPQMPVLLLTIPVILFVRMALNALDGMLARNYQLATPLGEILNEVGDIVSDTALYLPLIVFVPGRPVALLMVVLFVVLGIVCEFCGVLAKASIGDRRYDGPIGKSDRAFAIGLLTVLLYVWPPVLSVFPAVFLVLNLLLGLSCLNRLKAILKRSPTA